MHFGAVRVLPAPSPPSPASPTHPNPGQVRLTLPCVELSRTTFALWWTALIAVHFTALTYHARIAKFYWLLSDSPIGEVIELHDLSISNSYSRLIFAANAGIVAAHIVAILRMVRNTVLARQLVFSVDDSEPTLNELSKAEPRTKSLRYLITSVRRLFAYKGPFGVEGKYLDLALSVAEFVETGLQTYQASRVDAVVARRWISRLYVTVLVLNCWCVPLIHVVYHQHLAMKRLLSLMCDCLLDLVSSIIVPGALFYVYLADSDPATRAIERTRWYDDRWLVQLMSEYKLGIVTSWVDAVSRTLFAVWFLLGLDSVKQLLRAETLRHQQSMHILVQRASRRQLMLVDASATAPATRNSRSTPTCRVRLLKALSLFSSGFGVPRIRRVPWATIFHAGLALWGVVVVAIYGYAEVRHAALQPATSRPIQFHKSIGAMPVCLLVDINCHSLEMEGSASEIERQWVQVDKGSVLRIVLRHCPALEMPPSILEFRNLVSIKLYNSTLTHWSANSALSGRSLPALRSLHFVRVNFSNSQLPEALQSPDFPRGVRVIAFCRTNLRDLPSEVDGSWPKGMQLSFEASAFTSIPPVAFRLHPWQLSMSGNPIFDIPPEIFQSTGITRIGLARILATSWPSNLTMVSPTLKHVSIVGSPIRESPPPWMDPVIMRAQLKSHAVIALYAGDTPYCANPVLPLRAVSCVSGEDDVSYPLAFEDRQSGLLA